MNTYKILLQKFFCIFLNFFYMENNYFNIYHIKIIFFSKNILNYISMWKYIFSTKIYTDNMYKKSKNIYTLHNTCYHHIFGVFYTKYLFLMNRDTFLKKALRFLQICKNTFNMNTCLVETKVCAYSAPI